VKLPAQRAGLLKNLIKLVGGICPPNPLKRMPFIPVQSTFRKGEKLVRWLESYKKEIWRLVGANFFEVARMLFLKFGRKGGIREAA
jgi:hypothetical protein